MDYGCAIHACVLMTNHVHLLVTPLAADSLPRTMPSLGRRYVCAMSARPVDERARCARDDKRFELLEREGVFQAIETPVSPKPYR